MKTAKVTLADATYYLAFDGEAMFTLRDDFGGTQLALEAIEQDTRESFAAQKKALTAQAEEISRTVLELERKISGSDDNGNAVIKLFKSYAGITALTKEISTDLLHSVTIYPDGRMDIRLNLVDEIKALMETLRRESCTA